jgi:flagellar motility protein MotE (MotC chaperone)
MKGKKRIIILAGLGLASFGASFFLSGKLLPKPPGPESTDVAEFGSMPDPEDAVLNDLASAQGARLKPREQQLDDLIRELRTKMRELDRRERDLDEREQRLEEASHQLRKQADQLKSVHMEMVASLKPLREARAELLKGRAMIRAQEQANIESAAKMWEKMDPAQGARLLLEMFKVDQELAATKIFRSMNEKARAAILDEMRDMTPAVEIIRKQLTVLREQPR